MKHIPDTIGLKLTNPGARNMFNLPVQLASGNYTTLEVVAHSRVEALAMAKRHGYIVVRDGLAVEAPRSSGKAEMVAWWLGALAILFATRSLWWPMLASRFGIAP
jgi:hypothetical protein